MASPFIQIEMKEALDALQRLQKKTGNLTPTMRSIAGIMADAVEENFAQEGRPSWPALAESTITERKRIGKWPGKILQRSGSLAASINERSSATEASVGTNKIYAAIHQFGGKAGPKDNRVTIKARPFMNLTSDDIQEIVDLIEDRIVQAGN